MKSFINKIVDAPKLVKRIWILLWVVLIMLLIFKFCFGIWYPIAVENETFLKICNFVDANKILNLSIMGVFYVFSNNIIMLTCTNKKKYDNWLMALIVNFVIIANYMLKIFNSTAGNIIEILMIVAYIVINIIQNNFKHKVLNVINPIIFYGILNLWQLLIYLVRGLDLSELNSYPSLIYIIIMLDYYVFLTITWIGVCHMGLLSMGWLFTKDITVLKAEKEKELSKKNPDMDKIEKIEVRINELAREGR